MFKEDVYREIRDDFELSERNGHESFLCRFLREEKEGDIRILIRADRLKVADSQDSAAVGRNLRNFLEDMLFFMAKNLTRIGRCKEKETLFRLVDIEKDVCENGGRSGLKKAVEQKRENIGMLFREMDQNEIERYKGNLIEAGKIIIGLWDGAKREDPYIALWEEYLDHRLGERTADQVLQKAGTIYGRYRKKYEVGDIDKKATEILQGKAKLGGSEALEEIVTQLSFAILKAEAKAFLYDAGFPLPPKMAGKEPDSYEEEETGAVREMEIARKQDRVMDLIGSYCDSRGISVKGQSAIRTESSSVDIDSEEFRDAAEKLFCALRDNEQADGVYVPLCIDEKNGSGIYIIGRKNIPRRFYREKKWAHKAKDSFCLYCCLYGYDLYKTEPTGSKNEKWEELTITLTGEICEDIEEAILLHKGHKEEYAIYRDMNEKLKLRVDERFLPYFYDEEDSL